MITYKRTAAGTIHSQFTNTHTQIQSKAEEITASVSTNIIAYRDESATYVTLIVAASVESFACSELQNNEKPAFMD